MLFEIIAVIALAIATVSDLKKREVPDSISYGLLAVAVAARSFTAFQQKSFFPLIEGAVGFTLFFGIGYLLYKINQWGGGDTKILGSLGAMFGFSLNNLFMLHFFTNILIFGAIYGLCYAVYLAFKNRKEMKYRKIKHLKWVSFGFIAVLIIGEMFFTDLLVRVVYALIVLIVYCSIFIINFTEAVQKYALQKYVKPDVLTEGDWIGEDVIADGRVICRKKENGLTLKQIAELKELYKKGKVKKVLLKEGIPFLPSFLIAFIVTWMGGNVLVVIFSI